MKRRYFHWKEITIDSHYLYLFFSFGPNSYVRPPYSPPPLFLNAESVAETVQTTTVTYVISGGGSSRALAASSVLSALCAACLLACYAVTWKLVHRWHREGHCRFWAVPDNGIEESHCIHDDANHTHSIECTNRGGDCNDLDLDTVDIELQRIILTSSVHASPTPPLSKHTSSHAGSSVASSSKGVIYLT